MRKQYLGCFSIDTKVKASFLDLAVVTASNTSYVSVSKVKWGVPSVDEKES